MIRTILALALSFFVVQHSDGQPIKRKSSLGVGFYQTVTDSLARQLGYDHGSIVQFVVPNTTASMMGLLPNDIITEINGEKVVAPTDIVVAVKTMRVQDKVAISVIRNNRTIKLSGTAVAKPMETSTTAEVVYGSFAYKGGYVRTIFKMPKGKMPLGTVYFLQGLPCYSMDNFKDGDMTKLAIDALVERGFAVYRMEKADMGDNVHMPRCETMGFNEELEMYKAGYQNLLTLKGIDTSRIFLFGHSMGGITAPLLSEKFQPKGVVVYGTVFKPWMDYLFDAYLIQLQYYGEDLAMLREQVEQMKPYIYDYFYTPKTAEEICRTKEGQRAMEALLSYDVKTGLAASGRSPLCHKELNQHNVAAAWKNTNGHVLAVYGECDIAAIHPDDHIALVNYVNKIHPGRGTFWQAPGTTHTFEEIGTMDKFIKWQSDLPAYYRYAAARFNHKVFDHICDWMKDVLNK